MASTPAPKITYDRIDLDHVALAAEHAMDNFDRYRGDLGGKYIMGTLSPGFWWGQIRFSNGMKVELLEPANIDQNDFLRRFLDRSGPGAHHVTFKVKDIEQALSATSAAGYEAVSVNLDHEFWKEAFLHPKQSHGIVVQLAQGLDEQDGPADALPPARRSQPANLVRIVHLVADLEAAAGLFRDVLCGELLEDGKSELGHHLDLAWQGPGRIRLVAPAAGAPKAWLGTRPGRTHHLEFACSEPGTIPGARALADGVYEVLPEHNQGVRLRVHEERSA
jgi:catechol 2,3-dioxygenase-like lactoylglutathione lyase family enzyme